MVARAILYKMKTRLLSGHSWYYLFGSRTHISWLITAGCLGLILGVGVSILPKSIWQNSVIWLIFGLALFIISIISRLRIMIIIALLAGLSLGVWRGMIARTDLSMYQHYIGQEVRIVGTIAADPDIDSGNIVKLRVENVEIMLQSEHDRLQGDLDITRYFEALPGQIWMSSLTNLKDIKRSDRVEVIGKLKSGFGSFAATMSYSKLTRIERSSQVDPLRDLRDTFGDRLRLVIPSPAADLGMGILAGQKSALPADLAQAFIIASLTHIVVASGYNLTILIRFARRLFAKVSRLVALLFSSGLVIGFAAMVGFSPSMARASLVAMLSLVAWYYGRRFHPVTLLALVAAITVAISPTSVWGDVGWYLSFLSFVGVIILAPLLSAYFWGEKKTDEGEVAATTKTSPIASLRQVFIETLSAQLVAAPIIALFMGQFSLYGILANILVLPLLPFIMLLTFLSGLAAFVLPVTIASMIAWPATQLLNYIIGVANWVAELPSAQNAVSVSLSVVVIIYASILGVIFYLRAKTRYDFRSSNVVE